MSVDQTLDGSILLALRHTAGIPGDDDLSAAIIELGDERIAAEGLVRHQPFKGDAVDHRQDHLRQCASGEIPAHERLITIEDSAELDLAHANTVGRIAARGRLGESSAGPEDLLQAALRLRPDRVLLGEIRGSEALTFLHAVNSGHPGSMTTVHADSPMRAIDQIAMLAAQGNASIDGVASRDYADRLIDIVVQLDRTPAGRHVRSIRWRDVRH